MVQEHMKASDLVPGKMYSICAGKKVITGEYEAPMGTRFLFWTGSCYKMIEIGCVLKRVETQETTEAK